MHGRHVAKMFFWGGVGLLLAITTGCGPAEDAGRPPLGKVSGTVTYKGAPVKKAAVFFFVQGMKGARPAIGETDDQGKYTLFTYEPGDGAPVGNHIVTVQLRGPSTAVQMEGEDAPADGKPLIPPKYFSDSTSDLKAVVEAEKENVIDFTLEGNVPN